MKGDRKDDRLGVDSELNKWIRKNVFEDTDPERPLRVAFYIRGYSHEADGLKRVQEHSNIWSEQYDRCMALAKELGAEGTVRYPDEDAEYIDHTPARLDEQDALRDLLKRLITKRDIGIVITGSWDRLSRNQVDSFFIQQVIEGSGAKLLIASDVVVPQQEKAAA